MNLLYFSSHDFKNQFLKKNDVSVPLKTGKTKELNESQNLIYETNACRT